MRRIIAVLFLLPMFSFSQYRWDFGANLGGSAYLGEIGGKDKAHYNFVTDLKLKKTSYALGGFARYKFSQYISGKANLNVIRISGDDALSTNIGRRGRNLSFYNNLIDLEAVAQFFFLQIHDIGGGYKYKNDLRLYAFAGAAAYYSNPMAKYNGQKVALRPLMTEGQSKPYSLFGGGIPMGFGAYITFQRIIRVGIEATYVKTFSDYLDDVSTRYANIDKTANPMGYALANRSGEYTTDESILAQYEPGQVRGGSKRKDTYLYTAITASYVLKGKSAFYKAKYGGFFHKSKFKKRRVRAKF